MCQRGNSGLPKATGRRCHYSGHGDGGKVPAQPYRLHGIWAVRGCQRGSMKIGLVLCPNFQPVCFGAVAAFDVASKQAGEKLYDMRVLSEEGGLVASGSGMQVMTEAFD